MPIPSEKSPAGIFEASRRGERWAEEEIIRLIRGFARQVCGRGAQSGAPDLHWEDVAQEAALAFFSRAIRQYREEGSEQGFLYAIVRVTRLKMARALARRVTRDRTVGWLEASINEGSPSAGPLWARLELDRILDRLDQPCRDLLRRVFFHGAGYADLSAEFQLAEASVRSRLSRCIKRARELSAGNA